LKSDLYGRFTELATDTLESDDLIDCPLAGVDDEQDFNENDLRRVVKRENISKISTRGSGFNKNTILLDNGASVSLFRNKQLFKAWNDDMEPIFIDGVNESGSAIATSTGGSTFFGPAYYSKKVVTNILSYGTCVDNCHSVTYNSD
jgi:hypothetical protein